MKNYITLITLISFMTWSCETGEPESTTDFTIKNLSSFDVKISVFNAVMPNWNTKDTTFLLNLDSEINLNYYTDGENVSYIPFSGSADSAFVIFNDSRQIIYRKNDSNPRNILNIDSYDGGKIGDSYFKYTYYITDEDSENAVDIE